MTSQSEACKRNYNKDSLVDTITWKPPICCREIGGSTKENEDDCAAGSHSGNSANGGGVKTQSQPTYRVRTRTFLSIFHHPTIFKVNDYTSTSLNEALTILSQVKVKGGTAQERSSRYTYVNAWQTNLN